MRTRTKVGSLKEMCISALGRHGLPFRARDLEEKFGVNSTDSDTLGNHEIHHDDDPVVKGIKSAPYHYYRIPPETRRSTRVPSIVQKIKMLLSNTTIIVVPQNLVKQWCKEITIHTSGLRVLVMNVLKQDLPEAKLLRNYHIVLFSRNRFDKEARDDGGYHSPLKDVLFKRLIVDEGHTMGNSSSSSKTSAGAVVDFLAVERRWIISGTPAQGLYGIDVALAASSSNNGDGGASPASVLEDRKYDSSAVKQEKSDLEKLGHIVKHFLKIKPWANPQNNDPASWAQHVMQPRHGGRSRGSMACLTSTMHSIMVRHTPEDVSKEVSLPPLHNNIVHLEASYQDKLSLNLFVLMITSNAITSERKDADYLFHPGQRAALGELVNNLQEASFFWSGFNKKDVLATVEIAKQFLDTRKVAVSPDDIELLTQAIEIGTAVLDNATWQAASALHELPVLIENDLDGETRKAWSLLSKDIQPTIVGLTQVGVAQKYVDKQLYMPDPTRGLQARVLHAMDVAREALAERDKVDSRRTINAGSRTARTTDGALDDVPVLAGGVNVGFNSSPKRVRVRSVASLEIDPFNTTASRLILSKRSSLKSTLATTPVAVSEPDLPVMSTSLLSTASSKLSYLMNKILQHQATEKSLIFFESDNVGYYIAQALEVLHIPHLIYAKGLSADMRSQYVVAFNSSPQYRVLLMDIRQAALGLNMCSASRVYFVNPVFSPQIEAQALKRAHRIGQTRPVFVETLVMKGTLEERLVRRRHELGREEHTKVKSLLDDEAMYDWIKNVRFIPMENQDLAVEKQMAKLDTPQLVFGRSIATGQGNDAVIAGIGKSNDVDDLGRSQRCAEMRPQFIPEDSIIITPKRKASSRSLGDDEALEDGTGTEPKKPRVRKAVAFAADV